MQTQGQGHTSRPCDFPSILVRSISPKPFKRFSSNFTQMFLLVRRCSEPLTQLPLEFRVHTISPEYFCQFSLNLTQMFCSVRWCAAHITQLCRLKISVRGQGQGIYPCIPCPLHISWNLLAIFVKLHPNVPLSESVCSVHGPAT